MRLNGTSRKGNGPPGGSLGFALDRCWGDFSPRSWKSGRRQVPPASSPIPQHPPHSPHPPEAGNRQGSAGLWKASTLLDGPGPVGRPQRWLAGTSGSSDTQSVERNPEKDQCGENNKRESPSPLCPVSSGHPLGKVSSHGSGSKKFKGVSRATLPLQSVGRVRLWPLLAAGGGWPSVCSLARGRICEVSAPVGPHCSPSWVCVCLFLGGNKPPWLQAHCTPPGPHLNSITNHNPMSK